MPTPPPLPADETFRWPEGFRAAVSISFDDARPSQLDHGLAVLEKHGVKATFYVTLDAVLPRTNEWLEVFRLGHEIGNHSLSHPCSGNFPWGRPNALEAMTLDTMAADIDKASQEIGVIFGTAPVSYAYPCGQTFVGRGDACRSYVPLIAERFLVGRGFRNEHPNIPAYFDTAHAAAQDFDGASIDHAMALVRDAAANGTWLILAGHEIGRDGHQSVPLNTLDELCRFCRDPANGVWIDTVANVGQHIHTARTSPAIAGRKR